MEKSPRFYKTHFDSFESEYNNAVWDLVRKASEEKKPKSVFYQSLNYINAGSKFTQSLLDAQSLQIMQSGRPIEIRWDESKIYFQSILLNYSPSIELAALRKMSEFSFFDLKLVQLKIKKDKIVLEYNEDWAAIDPYKFFDVMDDLCNFGDYLESYMVKKFNIVSPNQDSRTFIDDKHVDAAWVLFQEISQEAKQFLDEFEKKRWREVCVEMFWNYMQKIEYALQPRGFLKLEIRNALGDFGPNNNFETMYAKVFTNFKKISEISKINFRSSFYKETAFMPAKRVAYVERTKLHFDDYLKNAFHYRSKQDHVLTTLYLNTAIYTYLNRYFCEKELEIYLRNLLLKSSMAVWKSSSDKLYAGLEKYIVNQNTIYQESVQIESMLLNVISWFKRIGR
ncbi:MAG: hypothetical protein JNL11_19625 [Bdellovibrionaceae bacterium]|nr:hypothetical protein [Pseudobdellovibrionaceae bacterium]